MERVQSANYRKNVLWNMIFSVLNAGQSMLLLMIVNRLAGEDAAGLFSFAFSVAVLMMNIGSYGIRNYQVSDVKEEHSFEQYCGFRLLTCSLMAVISVLYVVWKGFAGEKAVLVLLLCGMRIVECFEDVFHGRYQQKQHLYIACMQGTIRIMVSVTVFMLVLLFSGKLLAAVTVYTAVNLCSFLVMTIPTIPKFGGFGMNFAREGMWSLMVEGFPLFCGYFFITYLGNVAKYAIDDYGTYQMQAHFNMIFMPVLVINLISTMIFRPIIVDMATLWNQGDKAAFQRLVFRQIAYIGVLAVVMIPLGIWIGLPVLSFLYGTQLGMYRIPFCLLLLGGGLSAVSSFLNVCIITIRRQGRLFAVILMVSLLAALVSGIFVKNMGMFGAACLYLVLTGLQAAGYLIIEIVA